VLSRKHVCASLQIRRANTADCIIMHDHANKHTRTHVQTDSNSRTRANAKTYNHANIMHQCRQTPDTTHCNTPHHTQNSTVCFGACFCNARAMPCQRFRAWDVRIDRYGLFRLFVCCFVFAGECVEVERWVWGGSERGVFSNRSYFLW